MADQRIERLGHEIKFVLPMHRAHPVEAFLRGACRPDPKHPAGVVASLYFDTPGLHLLREKLNSDYYKTKVRMRWYEDRLGGATLGPLYAEAKQRVGTRRHKLRVRTEIEGRWLAAADLTSPEVHALPGILLGRGMRLPQPLLPLVVVRYERRRYIDPVSGSRIALDTRISAGRCNPLLAAGGAKGASATAVLEVKGTGSHLPDSLRPLASLGCRRSSFSKYAVCCEALSLS